jgi:hypothetical protein
MLYEVKKVKQEPGRGRKRWFTDEYFDLFLWIDERGGLTSFQLTYDKGHDERAVTWTSTGGISHTGIDDGESSPLSSMTPLLRTDGVFDSSDTAEKFKKAAQNLDPGLTEFIYSKLVDFPAEKNL